MTQLLSASSIKKELDVDFSSISYDDRENLNIANDSFFEVENNLPASQSQSESSWEKDFVLKLSEESDSETTKDHFEINNDILNENSITIKTEIVEQNCLTDSNKDDKYFAYDEKLFGIKIEKHNDFIFYKDSICEQSDLMTNQNQNTIYNYFHEQNNNIENKSECKFESQERDASKSIINDSFKIIEKLMNARVVLERLPESVVNSKCNSTNENSKPTLTNFKRFCKNCKDIGLNNSNITTSGKKCKICNKYYHYQCTLCNKICISYGSYFYHVKYQCVNFTCDYHCPKCDFKTFIKESIARHLKRKHKIFNFKYIDELLHGKNVNNENIVHIQSNISAAEESEISKCDQFQDVTTKNNTPLNVSKYSKNLIKKNNTKRKFFNKIKWYCKQCNIVTNYDECNDKKCRQCNASLNLQCINCQKNYKDLTKMRCHLREKCSVEKCFNCSQCNYKTFVERHLKIHFTLTHSKQSKIDINKTGIVRDTSCYYCPKCKESRENPSNYQKDALCVKCRTILLLECKMCKKRYEHYNSLTYHIFTKCKRLPNLHCTLCEYKIPFRAMMERHVRMIHGNPKDCSNCGVRLKNLRTMSNHKKYCQIIKKYNCDLCDYKTNKRKNLKIHLKNHYFKNSTDLPVSIEILCAKCDKLELLTTKIFKCRNCRAHLFVRCSKCNSKFAPINENCQHISSFFEKDQYTCFKCHKNFFFYPSLKNHEKVCNSIVCHTSNELSTTNN